MTGPAETVERSTAHYRDLRTQGVAYRHGAYGPRASPTVAGSTDPGRLLPSRGLWTQDVAYRLGVVDKVDEGSLRRCSLLGHGTLWTWGVILDGQSTRLPAPPGTRRPTRGVQAPSPSSTLSRHHKHSGATGGTQIGV